MKFIMVLLAGVVMGSVSYADHHEERMAEKKAQVSFHIDKKSSS